MLTTSSLFIHSFIHLSCFGVWSLPSLSSGERWDTPWIGHLACLLSVAFTVCHMDVVFVSSLISFWFRVLKPVIGECQIKILYSPSSVRVMMRRQSNWSSSSSLSPTDWIPSDGCLNHAAVNSTFMTPSVIITRFRFSEGKEVWVQCTLTSLDLRDRLTERQDVWCDR